MCLVHSKKKSLALSIALMCAAAAHAVPVVPGAAGFGMTTPAGRGGAVYRVTNINASGAGSLKACIDATGPRTCVFEVSGVIKLTSELIVRNGFLTIAGQTAPSPGIMIRGAAINVHASDILIQHIRIRVGDDPVGPNPENRDAFKINGTVDNVLKNIVIDHCSFSWSIDEVASVWGPHDNISFINNIFSEPLHDSIHPTKDGTGREPHGFGMIIDSADTGGRVTMVGNLFAHSVERNPLSRARQLVFVNNLIYDRANIASDFQSESGHVTLNTVVGNQYLKGPSYVRTTRPIYVQTDGTSTVAAGSKVYLSDNYAPDTGSSLSAIYGYSGNDLTPGILTSTMPVWNSGIPVVKTANNALYDSVLKNAGARPADRDTADKRAVSDVKNRTGQTINCVSADGSARCSKNAGGWPTYAVNTRALTLPANQATITSSGYSNLELWLHQLDKQVVGTATATSPAAPAVVIAK